MVSKVVGSDHFQPTTKQLVRGGRIRRPQQLNVSQKERSEENAKMAFAVHHERTAQEV